MSRSVDFAQKIKDRTFYIEMLKSDECLCGKAKKPKNTFCYKCYKSLPAKMQKDLYRMMGDGYEEAVDAACIHLQQEVW